MGRNGRQKAEAGPPARLRPGGGSAMVKFRKALLLAVKIGLGSSMAIYTAQALNLDYAISAGTVTLLTLMTSKRETVRLSAARFITFAMTLLMAWIIFSNIDNTWIAYGVLLTLVVLIAETFGWRATVSVNAVVAAHLLTSRDFSAGAVRNEFLLVLIGAVFAVVFNMFHANFYHRGRLVFHMRATEQGLRSVLGELAAYLSGKEMRETVWDDICTLEAQIKDHIKSASEYQDNMFRSHPEYYVSYFEMRYQQCLILRSLHDELVKIRDMPDHAAYLAEYLLYLSDYVVEINYPAQQIARLEEILEKMRRAELPKTREEFEIRAMLYHIYMDIQDFLTYKADFVGKLDQTQLKRYWDRDNKDAGARV